MGVTCTESLVARGVAGSSLALALTVCLRRCALTLTLAGESSPTMPALFLLLLLLVAGLLAAILCVAASEPRADQAAVRL
jgi:hypothetical protein